MRKVIKIGLVAEPVRVRANVLMLRVICVIEGFSPTLFSNELLAFFSIMLTKHKAASNVMKHALKCFTICLSLSRKVIKTIQQSTTAVN